MAAATKTNPGSSISNHPADARRSFSLLTIFYASFNHAGGSLPCLLSKVIFFSIPICKLQYKQTSDLTSFIPHPQLSAADCTLPPIAISTWTGVVEAQGCPTVPDLDNDFNRETPSAVSWSKAAVFCSAVLHLRVTTQT